MLGFVPVIGQTVVPVLGALVSGFFLAVELTGLPMERRGLLRRTGSGSCGGTGGGARLRGGRLPHLPDPARVVVTMPAAVAGSVVLVRTLVPEPDPAPDAAADG